MDTHERNYWAALSFIPGLGPVHFKKLLEYFSSAYALWMAPEREIRRFGFSEKLTNALITCRQTLDPEALSKKLSSQNIRVLTLHDDEYPSLLKEIYDPPFTLFVKGNGLHKDSLFLSVVGTRRITPYGSQAIEYLIGELVRYGLVIVSGLARGGDAIAHTTAIDRGGSTVAVLGCGVNVIYPPEHKALAERITQHGALISEFPPDLEPQRHFFPIRNRIISGMSLGVLVVEASEKSGTLITAQCALDQNREVFALPGSIFNPFSQGPARLIKMGAKLVTNVSDIIEELHLEERRNIQMASAVIPETPEEGRVLAVLARQETMSIDELTRAAQMPIATLSALLTVMEMKGKIKNFGGGMYAIKK